MSNERNILLEGFGAPINEELIEDGSDINDIASRALDELDAAFGLDSIGSIITGMNANLTHALEDVVEERDLDVAVDPFYPNINNIMDEDDLEYQDAWKQGYTWRNNKCFVPDDEDDEQTLVSIVVRLGDAGDNGQELLRHARRKGVHGFDINLDDMVDRDAAYGDADVEADAAA